MLKKFSKLLLVSLLIFTLALNISVCFADNEDDIALISDTSESNPVETSETDENSTTTTTEEEDPTHYGDLYLCDTNVVIDNVVYGNVYVIADTVEITGQIEGNLFVLTNSLKLDSSASQGGIIGGSIYACANSIYYNGACTYLYAVCNNIEMTYDSYVVRDAKISSSTASIKAAIGRNIDISSGNIDFGEEDDIPLIYGNLTYSSNTNVEIPDGIVTGNVEENVIQKNKENSSDYSISDIVIGLITAIVTIIVLYFLLNKFTPNFIEKIDNKKLSVINILKAFGLGLLSIIAVTFVSIILLVTSVGIKLGFILVLSFVVLCFIAVPILGIAIAKSLKSTLKLEKNSMFILVLCLVSIILYGVTLIPYIGSVLNFIIKITAIGLIIYSFIPNKVLTDEEIAKKIKDKEKKKQEKLEAKKAKKAEKNELNG